MLREDEADGADDEDLMTQNVLLLFLFDVHHGARMHGPVRSIFSWYFCLLLFRRSTFASSFDVLGFDRSSSHSRIVFWYAWRSKRAKNHVSKLPKAPGRVL